MPQLPVPSHIGTSPLLLEGAALPIMICRLPGALDVDQAGDLLSHREGQLRAPRRRLVQSLRAMQSYVGKAQLRLLAARGMHSPKQVPE
jgi:hypothetical protein